MTLPVPPFRLYLRTGIEDMFLAYRDAAETIQVYTSHCVEETEEEGKR